MWKVGVHGAEESGGGEMGTTVVEQLQKLTHIIEYIVSIS